MILDDVQEAVERHGDELIIEGIDAVQHWAKELGITRQELLEFMEERASEIYILSQQKGMKVALMTGWMDGFIKGYFAHRERRGVAPT